MAAFRHGLLSVLNAIVGRGRKAWVVWQEHPSMENDKDMFDRDKDRELMRECFELSKQSKFEEDDRVHPFVARNHCHAKRSRDWESLSRKGEIWASR